MRGKGGCMINEQQQMIEMELELQGEDVTEEDLLSLQGWLRDKYQEGVIKNLTVNVKRNPPKLGELGLDLVALSVILAAPAVVKLVELVNTWILTRSQRRMKVKFIDPNGNILEMETEGFSESQIKAFIDRILAIMGDKK
jgi:hypothetical protein